MDIKNYGKENLTDFVEQNQDAKLSEEQTQNLDELKEKYGNKIEDMLNKFQNLSEPELMREIFTIINKKKQEGTFNPNEIKRIAQTIKPFLSYEQQQKLEELLSLIGA